jgi:hypothetical protein
MLCVKVSSDYRYSALLCCINVTYYYVVDSQACFVTFSHCWCGVFSLYSSCLQHCVLFHCLIDSSLVG